MASSKGYLEFILEQLAGLEDVSGRAMMGEYVLYYRGRVFGGIYDDRFLVKPTKSACAMMPKAARELPYEGAKEMLLVDNVEDREFLCALVEAMYPELPAPKRKKEPQRIAFCGVDCAACPDFQQGKCPDCRSSEWPDGDACPPVACCRSHGIECCGACGEFPCEMMREFYEESGSHRQAFERMRRLHGAD